MIERQNPSHWILVDTSCLSSQIMVILYFVFVISCLIYYISNRKFKYWEKRKVPYAKPVPILGNFGDLILLKTFPGNVVKKLCGQFPDAPYIGAYYGTEPALIVQDPELLKLIITKDYFYFNGRAVSDYAEREFTTQGIFFIYGDKWRVLRQNLTPLFTTAKMKKMFHLIEKRSCVFENVLEDKTCVSEVHEIYSLMASYTMDCIGSCVFGIDMNAMQNENNNPFKRMGNLIFQPSIFRGFKNIVRSIWPSIFYAFGFRFFPNEIKDFFIKLLIEVFNGRDNKPSGRNDFVDLVLNFHQNSFITGDSIPDFETGKVEKVNIEVTDEFLAAQCVSFFGAGYETSATTSTLTAYELAKNVKAQARAMEEVDTYLQKHNNKLEYDIISELPYLEACIDETLRLYPVLTNVTREVMGEYTLPDGLRLEKGLRIHIPLYHLQRNPKYFPDPEEYIPERFLPEERHKIVPYTYMPFGEGPRLCLGMRFAKMQMLAGLITLLKNYKLQLHHTTPSHVEIEPRMLVTHPAHDINLELVPRKGY